MTSTTDGTDFGRVRVGEDDDDLWLLSVDFDDDNCVSDCFD